jgi:diguanylate cyclase (GGDEF)-like protein
MTSRGKTLIIIGLTLATLVGALYATSHIILLGSYQRLEEDRTRRNVERARDALAGTLDNIDNVTNDYGAWDDSCVFIEDGNQDFIQTNLPGSTFTNLKVDLIAFIHRSGRVVFLAGHDRHSGEAREVPDAFRRQLPDLLRRLTPEGTLKGLLVLPDGPLLFAARPILTSERQGPPRGTALMGRYLDTEEIRRLADLTHLSLAFHPYADPRLPADLRAAQKLIAEAGPIRVRTLDELTIAGYALLADAFGRPALLLRVDLPREIYQQGQAAIRYFLLWLVAIGLGFGGFAHWLAGKLFLSRHREEQSTQRLTYLTTHHPGTGLPNRDLLLDRLRQALYLAGRNELQVALLQLDLDHFKVVNDSLGHAAGDRLLGAVAGRLGECCRAEDTVAHLGGDEFAVMVPDLTRTQDAAVVARKLHDALQPPFTIEGRELFVTASIGITLFPEDGGDAEGLLRNADTALHQAKAQGRNTYQFFAAEMNTRTLARLSLETDLRRALERQEFLLHYQPQVDARSGELLGMEALVRWQHPERGLVPPLDFIPLAEETGLILPLGEWVLRTACTQNRAWQEQGLPPLRVSVNLSGRQLKQADLAGTVGRVLAETKLAPACLELELTESILMESVEATLDILDVIRAMGISLAMDDFGTGFSSLSYLKRFPIDRLKIDYSFVRDLTRNPSDAALVRTIIAMGHNLGLKVIAEGVETEEQLVFLREHGCNEVQGYYFSRPVPAEAFTELLRGRAGGETGAGPAVPG